LANIVYVKQQASSECCLVGKYVGGGFAAGEYGLPQSLSHDRILRNDKFQDMEQLCWDSIFGQRLASLIVQDKPSTCKAPFVLLPPVGSDSPLTGQLNPPKPQFSRGNGGSVTLSLTFRTL
jgi:hypothetical protein